MRPVLCQDFGVLDRSLAHANVVEHFVDVVLDGGFMCRLERVENLAKCGFLSPFAVVPWTALKRHYQDIVPNEMGLRARFEKRHISCVGPNNAQFFGAMDASLGAARLKGGAKIADGGNGRFHKPIIKALGGPCHGVRGSRNP